MDDPHLQPGTVGLVGGEAGTGEEGTLVVPEAPSLLEGKSFREVLRTNLFKDVKNTVVTIIFAAVLIFAVLRALNFLLITARWEVIYNGPLTFYMVGPGFARTGIGFTSLWIGIYLVCLAFGLGVGLSRSEIKPSRAFLASTIGAPALVTIFILSMTRTITPTVLTIVAVGVVFVGRWLGKRAPAAFIVPPTLSRLPLVPGLVRIGYFVAILPLIAVGFITGWKLDNINDFGGLLLTLTVALSGIGLSFPVGVMLALARRSSFPLIRPLAVGYIELIRGVPLISLLFMGQFALGFLFPPGTNVPGPVPRAIIMITAFSAAYVAEVVRGGLQSVPSGQTEAGKAIGLSPIAINFTIVLPQALRNSIPALIGQFISLLKDVALLVIIGQQEMLGVVNVILARQEFFNQGYRPEAYAFVGAVYWMLCFSMSRGAQHLETRLGVGTR